jgi:hypothetical protein
MAGTMPHAIFVETGLDDGTTVAAYAAELPGCAVFAPSDAEASQAIPQRVERFIRWLRSMGETPPEIIGDNWYEVERASTGTGADARASFSLDELPPSDDEWDRWRRWLELAREELAEAIDEVGLPAATDDAGLAALSEQDALLALTVGAELGDLPADPIDRFYTTREALLAALEATGPSGAGVRRALRIGIADDLRLAERLREGAR